MISRLIAIAALAVAVCAAQPALMSGTAEAKAEAAKGAAALRENDWDAAVEHYGKAVQLDPNYFEANEQYVFVSTAGPKNYQNEPLHQKLIEQYSAAGKAEPNNPIPKYSLGHIYFRGSATRSWSNEQETHAFEPR